MRTKGANAPAANPEPFAAGTWNYPSEAHPHSASPGSGVVSASPSPDVSARICSSTFLLRASISAWVRASQIALRSSTRFSQAPGFSGTSFSPNSAWRMNL